MQLERAARFLVSVFDESTRSYDEGLRILAYTQDISMRHISDCDVCMSSVKKFIALYPSVDEILG